MDLLFFPARLGPPLNISLFENLEAHNSVCLNWETPENADCFTITGYAVLLSCGEDVTSIKIDPQDKPLVLTDLQHGVTYFYSMCGETSLGPGESSPLCFFETGIDYRHRPIPFGY